MGASVLVLILVVSFAIDRLVRAILFLLSFKVLQDPRTIEDPAARVRAERRETLLYFTLAGFLGLIVVAFWGDIRVLKALDYKDAKKFLDAVITGIVLMGGSEFVGLLIDKSGLKGRGAESRSQPIEVTGKLILEGGGRGSGTAV